MSGRRAPLWLFGLVASAAIAVLVYNTRRERWDRLSKLEYARWVDGEVYSTETFVLVHFLSFGFLVQAAAEGGSRHAGP
jgi:hypothetical protein